MMHWTIAFDLQLEGPPGLDTPQFKRGVQKLGRITAEDFQDDQWPQMDTGMAPLVVGDGHTVRL